MWTTIITVVLFSSVLSSTKNDSQQLETTNNTIVLSSDTETDDTEDDTDDDEEEEEEGVEVASVSEVVDSSSSGMREVGGSTTASEATTPGTPFMPDMPSMPESQAYVLNSEQEQSSVISVSQLSCDDTTMASSAGATLGDSSITASLTAELASHPAKLAEVVVEGMGERDQDEEPVKERKRDNSVSEIIEDTFRDKSIAASFGEKSVESQKEEAEEPVEVEPSPSKRKSKGGEEEGGEKEEVLVVGEVTAGGLPAKRQVCDLNLPSR